MVLHYVIDINELPTVVDDINLKMYYGDKPYYRIFCFTIW